MDDTGLAVLETPAPAQQRESRRAEESAETCAHSTEYLAPLRTAPAAPEAASGYGPRLTALIAHLHGTDHLSYRAVADLLADVADLPIGLGSVVSSAERVSTALAPVDSALHAALQTATVINVDETSWRCAHKRAWLWVATSAHLSSFRITTSRGRAGLDALVAADYAGVIGSDRWSAYNRYPAERRQLCWAHLARNVRALAEARMPESAWVTDVLTQIDRLFAAWHAFGDGSTDRAGLQAALPRSSRRCKRRSRSARGAAGTSSPG